MRYPKQGNNKMTYAANIKKTKQTSDYMWSKHYLEKKNPHHILRKALFLSCMKCFGYQSSLKLTTNQSSSKQTVQIQFD